MNLKDSLEKRRAGSTLLIPVHRGREKNLKELLASVEAASQCSMYPVEVLIVTKDIAEIEDLISRAFPTFPIPIITRVYPSVETLGELRNEGIRAAKTEWLHSVDSDTTVPLDYFVKLEREMSPYSSQIKCFQLNFAAAADSSRWALYEAEAEESFISRYARIDGVFSGLSGINFVARPEALLSIGGFAEDLDSAEDVELGYRLYKEGVPVVFLPEVRIVHNFHTRLLSIMRRRFWHGKGSDLVRERCPDFINTINDPTEKKGDSSPFVRKSRSPWIVLYNLAIENSFVAGYYWSRISRKIKRISGK